jgi:hypothetical protein
MADAVVTLGLLKRLPLLLRFRGSWGRQATESCVYRR